VGGSVQLRQSTIIVLVLGARSLVLLQSRYRNEAKAWKAYIILDIPNAVAVAGGDGSDHIRIT
jgi:hypothetical protein